MGSPVVRPNSRRDEILTLILFSGANSLGVPAGVDMTIACATNRRIDGESLCHCSSRISAQLARTDLRAPIGALGRLKVCEDARNVLDTTILIGHWRRLPTARPLTEIDEAEVERWAQQLIKIEQSDATVTPVSLEVSLRGWRSSEKSILARAFLKPFKAIDDRRTLKRDWQEALRLAGRVPANRKPRDFGDCLIKAIAQRLNHDVRTLDSGMPRS